MSAYPQLPGWKEPTTSRTTARAMNKRGPQMRLRVLELFRSGFVGTADDVADRLHMSPFSSRPRCTELLQLGLIERVKIDHDAEGRARWLLREKRG